LFFAPLQPHGGPIFALVLSRALGFSAPSGRATFTVEINPPTHPFLPSQKPPFVHQQTASLHRFFQTIRTAPPHFVDFATQDDPFPCASTESVLGRGHLLSKSLFFSLLSFAAKNQFFVWEWFCSAGSSHHICLLPQVFSFDNPPEKDARSSNHTSDWQSGYTALPFQHGSELLTTPPLIFGALNGPCLSLSCVLLLAPALYSGDARVLPPVYFHKGLAVSPTPTNQVTNISRVHTFAPQVFSTSTTV